MNRRFRERVRGLFLMIGFFGVGGAYLAWRMFVAPNEMMIPWLEVRPGNPIAWVGLVGSAFMVLLGLYRMTWAPHRVDLDGEELRFGVRARRRLDRAEVAGVERRRGEVLLRLHDREGTLRRLDMLDDLEGVALRPGDYRGGEDLPEALEAWWRADGGR